MSRYFTSASKPRAEWISDDFPLIPSLEVSDFEASDTGLLDEKGDAIWRAPNPIGFGRDEEW